MTALTFPARPPQQPVVRSLPWRRMGWVTWRQHRLALAGVAVLLGGLAILLWIVGLRLHSAYAAVIACHPISSAACSGLAIGFNGQAGYLANGFLLQAVPPLIGAFVGAPLLARELESGTFRFAWTQGFGRWRWVLAKLVLLGSAVAAGAGALSVLLSWYYQPYFSGNPAMSLSEKTPFFPGLFDLRGPTFAAWTLAAFATGALAGALIRRVVPAIVATLAGYAALAVGVGAFLRGHYLAPLVTSNPNLTAGNPGSAWIMSQWGTKNGQVAFVGQAPSSLLQSACPASQATPPGKSLSSVTQCLSQHGYTLWTSYQPASRYWPFQWIEAGWLLGLSVLLIGVTVWLVQRRAT